MKIRIVAGAALVAAGVALSLPVLRASAADTPVSSSASESSTIGAALAKADAAVAKIVAVEPDKRTFENTIGAIDDLVARLNADTQMLQFMQYVSTDGDEREKSRAATEEFNNWVIALTKREDLYKAVKGYADTNPKLEGERARLLQFLLRDYKRDGMGLSKDARDRLTKIQQDLNKLQIEFEATIRDDETVLPLSREELLGVNDELLSRLPRSGSLYIVGMAYPTYNPVMEQCDVEGTRQKLYTAYKRRGGRKNVETLEKILKLRAEEATLLGYATTADFEQEVLMAKSSANVAKFYEQLKKIVRKKAELDVKEFQDAKRAHTGNAEAKLQPWDFAFYKNYLLKTKYKVDPEDVQLYFPMQGVVDGLFSVTQKLYGIEYREITSQAKDKGRPIWHPDVRLFEVVDKGTGQELGQFYLDLHPRPNKYNHAAQWGLFDRKTYMDGTAQKPLGALVCNFTKPTPDKPSLLTHEEVETFFHEFGHCLHTILTEATIGRFAGANTERDFVEAPSQMFENWVWNAEVLGTFAKHYQTGQPLPKDMLERMVKARNLGSGIDAENQFFYGLTDQTYHTAAKGEIDTTKAALDVFKQATLFDPVPETWFQASFGHLVGYQAGYYGYMWSLVYASDMFTRFKDKGLLNPEAGMYYRKKILARGGTVDGLEMVKDYLGREPQMEPFLEHLGLTTK